MRLQGLIYVEVAAFIPWLQCVGPCGIKLTQLKLPTNCSNSHTIVRFILSYSLTYDNFAICGVTICHKSGCIIKTDDNFTKQSIYDYRNR